MYGKCFLVLFSLLLLVVTSLVENFRSLQAETLKQVKNRETCTERLLPVHEEGVFSRLVRETTCKK